MGRNRHARRGRLPRPVSSFARRTAAGLLLAFAALSALPVHAQTEVPADWPLNPSGLGAGDQFQLLIVTSTKRNAQSSTIGDYDTHVQNAVAAGQAPTRREAANDNAAEHGIGFRLTERW